MNPRGLCAHQEYLESLEYLRLRALILLKALALYKPFTYLLTYYLKSRSNQHITEISEDRGCDKTFNEVIFSICQLWLIREATSINYIRNSPVSMHIDIFSVIEFVTFGVLCLILCLMCHLQIILEDCVIKLIYLSLQCCCGLLLLLFCWAYVSGCMPFMSTWVCSCSMFIFIKRCLLACLAVLPRGMESSWDNFGKMQLIDMNGKCSLQISQSVSRNVNSSLLRLLRGACRLSTHAEKSHILLGKRKRWKPSPCRYRVGQKSDTSRTYISYIVRDVSLFWPTRYG